MEIDDENTNKKEVKIINCDTIEPEKANAFKKKNRKHSTQLEIPDQESP